jgi:hypothetical protein
MVLGRGYQGCGNQEVRDIGVSIWKERDTIYCKLTVRQVPCQLLHIQGLILVYYPYF